jgi:hypothetical protein
VDDERDYTQGCWAGVVPLALTAAEPIADPVLPPGIAFAMLILSVFLLSEAVRQAFNPQSARAGSRP